jgi:hypoxanthine-guanine phosphoribosyltransferase
LAQEYVTVRKEADRFITVGGWIDATQAKTQATFGDSVVHKLLYRDFYSIEKFGKTQLGQMVLSAKTSQNIKIIESIIEQIKPVVERIMQEYKIDTIAYIPPSIKRQAQLMTELKNRLQIRLPEIVLVKAYTGDVIVSQKSLSKFQERIVNAQSTIFVDVNKSALLPKNVLLIDDAVGSGATIHETAKQIQQLLNPKGYIIGFAVVGSMKGFEVIREI